MKLTYNPVRKTVSGNPYDNVVEQVSVQVLGVGRNARMIEREVMIGIWHGISETVFHGPFYTVFGNVRGDNNEA